MGDQKTLRKKPRKQKECCGGLKRCLGPLDLILLGLGGIIGTGIFVLTGVVSSTQTGPAIVLSFTIAGIACAFVALSYAELAASIGGCGSSYGYCRAAFGKFTGWIVGWSLLLGYGVAVAAVANGWSSYFGNALQSAGIHIPAQFLAGPFSGGMINIPATGIVLLLMLVLIIGAKHGARLNALMVATKLLTIVIFAIVALPYLNPDHWSPFLPFGWFGWSEAGKPTGVLSGAAMVSFAYVGFDIVATASEEARDPKRDLPIGIIGSLVIATILYVAVSGLLTGIVPYSELNTASPISYALQKIGCLFMSGVVAIGAITGITTVLLVVYFGLTRVLLAIARDGLLPSFIAKINSTTHTPIRAIVILGFVMSLAAGFVSFNDLAELVNIGILLPFFAVCVGVVRLRTRYPDMKRPFRLPFGRTIPILGALFCIAFGIFLSKETWMRFLLWQGIGLLVYLCYSARRGPAEQKALPIRTKTFRKTKRHGRKKKRKNVPWKR